MLKHGVKGGHHRDVHLAKERQQMPAGGAAVDAELMLDAKDVHIADA